MVHLVFDFSLAHRSEESRKLAHKTREIDQIFVLGLWGLMEGLLHRDSHFLLICESTLLQPVTVFIVSLLPRNSSEMKLYHSSNHLFFADLL